MGDLPTVFVAGQNKFGQYKTLTNTGNTKNTFGKINWSEFGDLGTDIINFDITASYNYSVVAVDFKVVISTVDLAKQLITFDDKDKTGPPYSKAAGGKNAMITKSFEFPDLVAKVQATSKYCLVLLEQGEIYKIMMGSFEKQKLDVFVGEVPRVLKRSFFTLTETVEPERIVDIACGEKICVGVTNYNGIYSLPSKIHQFEKHEKIKKVVCGAEHAMLLTENGDLYTWGTGLRGQLGHGEIESEELPKLVESLGGIKLIDIAAGTFHSAAVSVFGDLYVWGWNACGQLGLKVYVPTTKVPDKLVLRRKNQTVYTVPLLVDFTGTSIEDNNITVSKVYCGSNHTVIRTRDFRVLVTGSNSFNQLGLILEDKEMKFEKGRVRSHVFIDEFKELKVNWKLTDFDIKTAASATMFIENK